MVRQKAVCEGGEGLQCRSMMVGMKFLVVVFWADGSPALTVNATRGWGPGPGGRGLTRLGAGRKKKGVSKISEASKKSAVAGRSRFGNNNTIRVDGFVCVRHRRGIIKARSITGAPSAIPGPLDVCPYSLNIFGFFSPSPALFFSLHVYIVPAVSRVSFPSRAACSIIHGPSITHHQQGRIPAQSHGRSSRRDIFFLPKPSSEENTVQSKKPMPENILRGMLSSPSSGCPPVIC